MSLRNFQNPAEGPGMRYGFESGSPPSSTPNINGRKYFFCSDSCLAKFQTDPEHYIKPRAVPVPPQEKFTGDYTCPMHPEVIRQIPCDCPICGMALESRIASPQQQADGELIEMTRRLIISAILTLPVFIIAMSGMFPSLLAHLEISHRIFCMDRTCFCHTGCALGRLAVFCSRLALNYQSQSEYVYSYCRWHRSSICL